MTFRAPVPNRVPRRILASTSIPCFCTHSPTLPIAQNRPRQTNRLCMRTTPTTTTSATPSLAAALVALLLALSVSLPIRTRLTPRSRRILPAASASAFATAALLRPRHILLVRRGSSSNDDDADETISDHVDDDEKQASLNDVLDAAAQARPPGASVFQTSRQEWQSAAPSEQSPSQSDSQPSHSASQPSSEKPPSTVYSYSYARSKKNSDTASGAGSKAATTSASQGGASHASPSSEATQNLNTAFQSMRSEFEGTDVTENTNVPRQEPPRAHSPPASKIHRTTKSRDDTSSVTPPQPMTTSRLVSSIVRMPMELLSEVILPLVHIVSLIWYDCKVSVLDRGDPDQNRIDSLFFPPLPPFASKGRQDTTQRREKTAANFADNFDDEKMPNDGVELSEEEQQIEQVRRVTEKAVKSVGGTFRKIMGEFL